MRFVLVFFLAAAIFGQQNQTVEWKSSLQDLEKRLGAAPVAEWLADAEALRSSIAAFAASQPGLTISISAELTGAPDRAALTRQLEQLNAAVNEVIRQTPGTPFNLGQVEVNVSAPLTAPSPVTAGIDQVQISDLNLVNAAKALDTLPGVSIQHIAANRNEAGIMVRGFSTRGQIPLYVDGIPISVPYDGYVDFNRFLTSDIAEVEVSRGYSSPLLGPNALGGSINMVTEEPVKNFDADALMGTGSGDLLMSSLRLGSRWQHFFFLGSIDWLQQGYIPLSGDFPVHQYVNLPHTAMTDQLNHSSSRDERFTGRAGWTPKSGDEYVFSYINLKGQKGVPLYQGPNTNALFRTFWNWPYWNMDNYYFHSNTQLGETTSLKLRGFYSQFRNAIDMYSNDTYVVMNTRNAQHSKYDEHNDGFSTELNTRAVARNSISASFFFKDDVHAEHGIYPAIAPFPLTTPVLRDRDIQTSIGLQDVIKVSSRFSITLGFSADHFNGLQGQAYNASMTGLLPFTCTASPNNTSFGGCTAHVWNYNPQVAASYSVGKSGSFFVTFADRGRFPMLKDIYSAGLGSGLPNPNLRPEHSRNWNAGYSQLFGTRTLAQVVLFRSDLRDAIESVYVTDPGGTSPKTALCPGSRIVGFCNEMANIGSEVHKGVEAEVRSTPLPRLTIRASYSYLNRNTTYHFKDLPNVSPVNTSISILPTLPKNKFFGAATVRLPYQILGILSERYESGLTLQDTTYPAKSPLFLPYSSSYATTDLFAVIPCPFGFTVRAGVKNLLDRNYAYTAGYPEEGRNWFINVRFHF